MTEIKRLLAAVLACALVAGCGGMETRGAGEDLVKMQQDAQAAFDSGENARAEALYKGLARAMPNDAETWLRLGNLYARTDNADQAVNAYLTSLALNGADPRAWHNLGVVRLRQAWASLLRANTLTAPPEPIYVMSADLIHALEKMPYLSGGGPAKPAPGPAAPPAPGGSR
jgi:cytochrome c-type biogenesis protein CcmH/NrfG